MTFAFAAIMRAGRVSSDRWRNKRHPDSEYIFRFVLQDRNHNSALRSSYSALVTFAGEMQTSQV